MMNTIYTTNGDKEYEEKLLLPLIYALQVPEKNKNVFSKLTRAINFWFKLPQDKLTSIEAILKNSVSVGYIFDDILNNATVRKNMPTANTIYGIPATLNSCYYELFVIMQKLQELGQSEIFQIYVDHAIEISRGQAMEIIWRDAGKCPTEQEYLKMATKKMGHSILFAINLVQLFSDNKLDFTKLAQKLGVFVQICEDYRSFRVKEADDQVSGDCDSFSMGKFSFPVVYAVNNYPECGHLTNLLKKKTKNVKTRRYCRNLLEKCGSLDYTREKLTQLMEEIVEEVWKLGENPYMLQILEFFSDNLDI